MFLIMVYMIQYYCTKLCETDNTMTIIMDVLQYIITIQYDCMILCESGEQ